MRDYLIRISRPGSVIVAVSLVAIACSSPDPEATPSNPALATPPAVSLRWDLETAAALKWQADVPEFDQDYALEASGLTASENYLYVVSEKFATLLRIDPEHGFAAHALPLAVPAGAELEGLCHKGETIFICDEVHGAVYRVDLGDEQQLGELPLPVTELTITGIDIPTGKKGLEGIAVSADDSRLYLLVESVQDEEGNCRSLIFPMDLAGDALSPAGPALEIALEDCDWRLPALCSDPAMPGQLLALKTHYPGPKYKLLQIDTETGTSQTLLELSDLANRLYEAGWGNNLEGLTVAGNGDLFVVSDNATSNRARGKTPPPAGQATLLLQIAPAQH